MVWEKGMRINFNLSSANKAIMTCDLSKVICIFLNEIEGQWLTYAKDPERIGDQLIHRFEDLLVILTLGSNGSCYRFGATFSLFSRPR